MPKLPEEHAKRVDEEEGSEFEALPPGKYIARLMDVNVSDSPGPSGFHYWTWEFEVVEPEDHKGRKLWENTSLSDKAAFRLKMVFDAFGVPADTDTDLLCGKLVGLVVSQRTITQGSREGETGNDIDRFVPVDDGDAAQVAGDEPTPPPAADGDDDLF